MLLKKLIKLTRNLICIIGLTLISPLIFFAALVIILEDGVPIFFIQQRLGKNRKIFNIIKVRTLKTSAPQTGTHELDKKHKLKIGNIIRKVKLDEFPQLINVIKGDINLIGPRPGLPSQIELMNERSAKNIFSIKPGITGLAQILGYDMSDPNVLAAIDKKYIEKKSTKLNFLILIGTFFKYPRKHLQKLINLN